MKHTVEEVTLSSGLKGLLIDVPGANVADIEVNFRAGEFLLAPEKWETAHLMEHLMLGANKSYPTSREYQAALEMNGAYNNASTSVYDITYEVECATFEIDRILNLLCAGLSEPIFKENEFTAEFGNVYEELVGRSNNHFRALSLGLRQALELYSLTDEQRIERIHNVTLEDVKAHYLATHSIKNARFIVAGDIKNIPYNILENCDFQSTTQRIEMPDEVPKKLNGPFIIERHDVPNYYFYIDMYADRLLEKELRDGLSLATTLLTETLHSKLLGAARERGLVYAMASSQQHLKSRSSFWIGAQVSKKNSRKLFDLIREVVDEMANHGVSDAELTAAKQYLRGRHERSAQTVGGVLGKYASTYYQEGRIEDELTYSERLERLQNDHLKQALQSVLTGGVWALGLLGKVESDEAAYLHHSLEPLFQA